MTMAEVRQHPGPFAFATRVRTTQETTLTVTDTTAERKLYTAAELLDVVLAAYERGLTEGQAQNSRDRWRHSPEIEALRTARRLTEIADMKRAAQDRYRRHGYPAGYDFRGGPVDWASGLPAGSGCAWLRAQRAASDYALAGGHQ